MVVSLPGAQLRGYKRDREDCGKCAVDRVDWYLYTVELDFDGVQRKLSGAFVVGKPNLSFAAKLPTPPGPMVQFVLAGAITLTGANTRTTKLARFRYPPPYALAVRIGVPTSMV